MRRINPPLTPGTVDAPPFTQEQELARLRALERYAILDTLPEEAFDRLATLAARLFTAPMALISLVDQDRQWFKACMGMDLRETDRSLSFCAHALHSPEVLVIPDALQDPRFAQNALVTGHPNIRFYAGAPLRTPDGFTLGTLCVLSDVPREGISDLERCTLQDLAAMVMDELELRVAKAHLAQQARADETLVRMLQDANRVSDVLLGIHSTMNLELNPVDIMRHAVTLLAQAADADWCGLLEVRGDEARPVSVWLRPTLNVEVAGHPPSLRRDGGLLWRALDRQRPLFLEDGVGAPGALPQLHRLGLRSGACLPLGAFDGAQYVLAVARTHSGTWRERDRALLETGAGSVELALSRRELVRRREVEALTDALTGLGNRRALDLALADDQQCAVLVAVNLAGFGEINHSLGHTHGDTLLRLFSSVLLAGLPVGARAFRCGGVGFVLLHTGAASPAALLALVEGALAAVRAVERHDLNVAVGCASFPAEANSVADAWRLADARMSTHQRPHHPARPAPAPRPYGRPTLERQGKAVSFEDLTVSVSRGLMQVGEGVGRLKPTEVALLAALAAQPEQPRSRVELSQLVWGRTEDVGNTLDVHVHHLRVKLARLTSRIVIRSQRGAGYALQRAHNPAAQADGAGDNIH